MIADSAARPDGFARGAKWSALGAAASIVLPLLTFVAFARSMDPVFIGVVALAVSTAEVLKAFGATGLYESVLARKDASGKDQAAALCVLLGAGLFLLPVHVVVVLGLLELTDAHGALPVAVILLVGLRIPIDLYTLQPQAELALRGAYARIAQRNLLTNFLSTGIALALLAAGLPLVAIVSYTVALSGIAFLATVLGTHALRRPRWDGERLRAMRREAIAATGNRGFGMANTQLDQVIVGALLGPLAIAHYNLGKRIEAAFNGVSSNLAQTLFQPRFAAAHDANDRLHAFRQSLGLICGVSGFGVAVFTATADMVTAVLLGPAWLAAAPVAAILAVSGFVRAVAVVQASLLSVTGHNGVLVKTQMASLVVITVLTLFTSPFGAPAAALGGAIRGLAVVVWLATCTGTVLPGPVAALYFRGAVLPFLAMLGLATAARALVAGAVVTAVPPFGVAVAAVVCAAIAAAPVCLVMILRLRPARAAAASAA